jgi:hypothetical protein
MPMKLTGSKKVKPSDVQLDTPAKINAWAKIRKHSETIRAIYYLNTLTAAVLLLSIWLNSPFTDKLITVFTMAVSGSVTGLLTLKAKSPQE